MTWYPQDLPSFLGIAVLQTQVVVIDRKDLVLVAIDQEQFRTRLVERAVIQQRELLNGLFLEPLEIGPVPKLVTKCMCKTSGSY